MAENKKNDRLIKILIIDDEDIVRDSIACYLEDAGYQVFQACNGKEGLGAFREHGPDIVLTDLRMPVLDGKGVIEAISAISNEIPIIVVSGTGDINDAIDTVHLGAWDYIVKPITDTAILDHAVQKSLDRSYLLKENRKYREDLEFTLRAAEKDLKMAINVQRNFLPRTTPDVEAWDIALEFRPMAGVSGDFYDFYVQDNVLTGLSLFDVSGHGISSGLVTMLAKSIMFRTFSRNQNNRLNIVMDMINSELIEEMEKVDNYLTGIMIRIDDERLEYVNSAHPPMLHRNAGSSHVTIVGEEEGYRSGALLGAKTVQIPYEMLTLDSRPGDVFLLYSDCLLETMNDSGKIYGIDRLINTFGSAPVESSCRDILDYILKDFFHYADKEALDDDLTIIVLKREG